jgi:hypothetical protein
MVKLGRKPFGPKGKEQEKGVTRVCLLCKKTGKKRKRGRQMDVAL